MIDWWFASRSDRRVGTAHTNPPTSIDGMLKILGRASLQKRAIGELVEQAPVPGLYASIEELLADYRSKLEPLRELSLEEEERLMNLSAAYLKKQQEWQEEGREEGVQTGIQRVAINLLRDGASLEFVAKATGRSIEVITQLREQNLGN